MATVYRVQDKKGGGPYRGATAGRCWELLDGHDDPSDTKHPTPQAEGFSGDRAVSMRCGFASLEAVRTWFTTHELAVMRIQGFHVCKLTRVRIVAQLARQLIFRE